MIEGGSSGSGVSRYGPGAIEALAGDEARWADATCVALLRGDDAGPETLESVQRLARGLRGHRRVFLLNLERPGSGLDERLSTTGRPGLAAVRRGELKVGEATVRPPDERFLYLPAGTPGAEPSGRPTEDPAVADLVERLRDRMEDAGWLLLVLLAPEETAALGGAVDGHVLLEPGLEAGPGAGPEIGRPGEERAAGSRPDGGDGEAAGEPAQWRRHRRRDGPPVGGIVTGVLVLAALAGGWWWLAGRAGEAAPGAEADDAAAAETPAAGSAVDTAAPGGGADVPAAEEEAPGEPAVPADAPELGYSVVVASYGNAELALGRAASWSDEALYFAAPTPVGGTTYWRVYAGAFGTPTPAEAMNRRLAASGRKDSARAWDVRPVPLAFRAGTFAARADAERRADALRREEVPAYVLAAVAGGDTVWQVYAGAYESEEDASALRSRLAEAGVEAELVTRRGEPTGP